MHSHPIRTAIRHPDKRGPEANHRQEVLSDWHYLSEAPLSPFVSGGRADIPPLRLLSCPYRP